MSNKFKMQHEQATKHELKLEPYIREGRQLHMIEKVTTRRGDNPGAGAGCDIYAV
jgi:hypothetical protein